jgi:hypothetical protein
MPTFVLLTSSADQGLQNAHRLNQPGVNATEQLRSLCPGVKRLFGYSLLGPWDQIDVFSAPSFAETRRALNWLRKRKPDENEICTAMPWSEFKQKLHRPPAQLAGPKATGLSQGLDLANDANGQTTEPGLKHGHASHQVMLLADLGDMDGRLSFLASGHERQIIKNFITASRHYFERGQSGG